MAILAVLEGGLPACRKATRTAGLPTNTPSSPQPDPTENPGDAVARFQAAASRRGRHRQRRAHQAGRTGGMVGDDVKQRFDYF
jgi:hypothetical protein